jgi:hypothetical protein
MTRTLCIITGQVGTDTINKMTTRTMFTSTNAIPWTKPITGFQCIYYSTMIIDIDIVEELSCRVLWNAVFPPGSGPAYASCYGLATRFRACNLPYEVVKCVALCPCLNEHDPTVMVLSIACLKAPCSSIELSGPKKEIFIHCSGENPTAAQAVQECFQIDPDVIAPS